MEMVLMLSNWNTETERSNYRTQMFNCELISVASEAVQFSYSYLKRDVFALPNINHAGDDLFLDLDHNVLAVLYHVGGHYVRESFL